MDLSRKMPVKWFLHWEPNEGSSSISRQMIIDEAKKCIEESFKGVKEETWKTTLSFYKPISQQAEFPNEFIGMSLGDEPSKYYYVIRRERLVVEADSAIQTIMNRLNSYKCRQSFHFEGFQYRIGDFRLRIGKVVLTNFQTIVSIIMQVECLPWSSIETAKLRMQEFVGTWQEEMSKRALLGKFVNQTVKFEEFGLADNYTSRHTAVQYAIFMAHLLKKVRDELVA